MAKIWRHQGRTESILVATHNQEICKNYFKIKILKEETDDKCQYVNNRKKLLTTYPQEVPFWRRMNT